MCVCVWFDESFFKNKKIDQREMPANDIKFPLRIRSNSVKGCVLMMSAVAEC